VGQFVGEALRAWRRDSCILLTAVSLGFTNGKLGLKSVKWGKMYLATCPPLHKTVFIWDRRSGSCVLGVYAATAFGTRTGVVGSEGGIVYGFV
jgi:hypothetical protein